MYQNPKKRNMSEVHIKFGAPIELRQALQQLADERSLSIAALIRLILSEYVKRNRSV